MAQGWPKAPAVMDNAFPGCRPLGARAGHPDDFRAQFAAPSRTGRCVDRQSPQPGIRSAQRRGPTWLRAGPASSSPGSAGWSVPKIRPDISPTDVGNQVWITVHGCHLLSDALDDDVIARLARSWHMLLPAMVPDRLAYIEEFVDRTAGNQRPS